jgi:hypothetical protein
MSQLGPAIARLFELCLEVIFWLVEEAGDLDEWKFFVGYLKKEEIFLTYFGQNVFLQSYS